MQQKYQWKAFQAWHRDATVSSDAYLSTQPYFVFMLIIALWYKMAALALSSHLQSREKGGLKQWQKIMFTGFLFGLLIWSLFMRKQQLLLDASPGDFHLYLIGQNEVPWLYGKCNFFF